MNKCPIVETSLGKVRGKVLNNVEGGRDVLKYSSIPFAKPPVGELRFEPPVEAEPWDGIIDGTKHPPAPQQDLKASENLSKYIPSPTSYSLSDISEDCLYLTVFTTTASETANLPVLLWLYGGGFTVGGECCYDMSVLTALHDVVVVVPNYRVGIFGFLSMGKDSVLPGNVGLLDHIMAMKWVRKHIQNFGGNPNNITLSGQSAGGGAVNYHVVSPMSKGLFDKAISHSGSLHVGEFLQESDGYALGLLLKELKIEEKDDEEIVKKLKSTPVDEITEVLPRLAEKMAYFAPVVDGKFLTKTRPGLTEDKVNPVPYLLGCNSSEGSGVVTADQVPGFSTGIAKETCIEYFKGFIGQMLYKGLPDSGYDLLVEEYSKNIPDDEKKWSQMYGLVTGDAMFVNPMVETAKQHFKNECPTFVYKMSHPTKYCHDTNYGPETAQRPSFCECDHGDDLIYTFGLPFYNGKLNFDVKFTDNERTLSREWMKYIVNFATNGDPNVGLPTKVKWPQYDTEEHPYLAFKYPITAEKGFADERNKFWNEVIAPMTNSNKDS